MSIKPNLLSVAIRVAVGISLVSTAGQGLAQSSQEQQEGDASRRIEEIEVRALGVRESADRIAPPFSIIGAQQLLEEGAATLGDALSGQPGVHSDTYGGGASRPVIRGQTAPRVTVLSDGASILDASGISPDHAVAADPLLAQQIEVLRGPATLLYGGGAIGGVVNVVDNKVPTYVPDDNLEGMLSLRGNSVADEGAGALSLTGRVADNLAFHLEGSHREADDYKVPDWHESRVEGTWTDSENVSGGLSWVDGDNYLGLAYSYRHDQYGLAGHEHEYEDCHPHGSSLHCGGHGDEEEHDHDHEHEHEHGSPFVDLVSRRVDVRGEFNRPFTGVEQVRLRASYTDYRHDEAEAGEVGSTFTNEGYEARVEIQHVPVAGWIGVLGLQYSDTDFGAVGEEAFVPNTAEQTMAVFIVEHLELNEAWHLELGARHERQDLEPEQQAPAILNRPAMDDQASSFSASAIWAFAPRYSLTFSAAHSERMAQSQELYARGIHLGTNTYECGLATFPISCGEPLDNSDIEKETSRNIEVRLAKSTGDITFSIGGFHNKVDDYIYARTLDQYEDFRLIQYSQQNATFTGLEAEVSYQWSPQWSASLFGDTVRADFDDGANLPRISPPRYGVRVNAAYASLDWELEYYRVERQEDAADFEERTPGYNMLNMTLGYVPDGNERYLLFLRGNNLLDEQVWNHTSFLANTVPLPGRNISAGLKLNF